MCWAQTGTTERAERGQERGKEIEGEGNEERERERGPLMVIGGPPRLPEISALGGKLEKGLRPLPN